MVSMLDFKPNNFPEAEYYKTNTDPRVDRKLFLLDSQQN
jgi:hypothetical protein